ncbi:hypothetical protein [Roseovarius amoyensis]|uniref:hypothetical protein n=1 Tax=Roseovarius amoyensis TaxID=2211448 RepID=UPI0013A6A62C|nr:hypothetical protein [Roseovarius amoyensis]
MRHRLPGALHFVAQVVLAGQWDKGGEILGRADVGGIDPGGFQATGIHVVACHHMIKQGPQPGRLHGVDLVARQGFGVFVPID